MPTAFGAHELPCRQGIEELIGNEKQRCVFGHIAKMAAPFHAHSREGFRLNGAQGRARFHKTDMHSFQKSRSDLCHTQHVGHQRATARPQLDEMEFFRPSTILPGLNKEQPNQLAENLAYLRGRDEIAPDRIGAHVVTAHRIAERDLHILADGDRSLSANEAENRVLQSAHGLAGKGFRIAYQKKNAAAAHIGKLNNCPMLNQA